MGKRSSDCSLWIRVNLAWVRTNFFTYLGLVHILSVVNFEIFREFSTAEKHCALLLRSNIEVLRVDYKQRVADLIFHLVLISLLYNLQLN
jgi:hypothetical protein